MCSEMWVKGPAGLQGLLLRLEVEAEMGVGRDIGD